jgi:formylglycine-generating enzyme required for sulfatase activity/acetyl esterase/lipase
MNAPVARVICILWGMAAVPVMAAPPPVLEPIAADVSYGPHPHQLLDVYAPKEGGPHPVLLWYGGLWKPAKHAPDPRRFLAAGCAVVAVELRTMSDAVEDKVKEPVSYVMLDACRAVQFIRANAGRWNLNPARIAVGGGSQGSLPALYVACAGDRADSSSADPLERASTRVVCCAAYRSQPSIDPQRMQEWVPGVKWGAPALGCTFEESLQRRDELLPIIRRWSPDALVNKDAAPIYFENEWGLEKPADVEENNYKVHSPAWALGFQKVAQAAGATCHVKFLGHPTDGYKDIWDFITQSLTAAVDVAFPRWDGKESIADYARRAHVDPTLTLDLGNGVKWEGVLIPAGEFVMGSPPGEAKTAEEAARETQHKVVLTRPIYMGKFELTQAQYKQVTGVNPSVLQADDLPVHNLAWQDAADFCPKLAKLTGRAVRLPTEAEWEYACRAGTTTPYSSGDTIADLDKVAWYGQNSGGKPHPVGQKAPNAWGLYDMHGNIREFVADLWGAGDALPDATDPTGPAQGDPKNHVVRGGAYTANAALAGNCRSASRRPTETIKANGFRIVVDVAVPAK